MHQDDADDGYFNDIGEYFDLRTILPKGKAILGLPYVPINVNVPPTIYGGLYGVDISSSYDGYWLDPNRIILDNRTKCQCGTSKIMKEYEDDWTFHSDYCPIKENRLDVRIKSKE